MMLRPGLGYRLGRLLARPPANLMHSSVNQGHRRFPLHVRCCAMAHGSSSSPTPIHHVSGVWDPLQCPPLFKTPDTSAEFVQGVFLPDIELSEVHVMQSAEGTLSGLWDQATLAVLMAPASMSQRYLLLHVPHMPITAIYLALQLLSHDETVGKWQNLCPKKDCIHPCSHVSCSSSLCLSSNPHPFHAHAVAQLMLWWAVWWHHLPGLGSSTS